MLCILNKKNTYNFSYCDCSFFFFKGNKSYKNSKSVVLECKFHLSTCFCKCFWWMKTEYDQTLITFVIFLGKMLPQSLCSIYLSQALQQHYGFRPSVWLWDPYPACTSLLDEEIALDGPTSQMLALVGTVPIFSCRHATQHMDKLLKLHFLYLLFDNTSNNSLLMKIS